MRELFKKSVVIFLALSLSLLALPGHLSCKEEIQTVKTHVFSLKDMIDLALKNNKDIQIQEQEIAFARANIMSAQSKFFPALGIGYSYTYYDAFLPLSSFSFPSAKKDPGLFMGYKNDNQVNVTGNQMIYDGGASIANLKKARVSLKIQEETLRQRILDVEFEAKRLYYGLLLAYETLRITKGIVEQAQAHYENVKSKFEQGTSSKFDVLQSKVQVSLFMPQLINAENSIELIAADIKKLLYIGMQDKIEVLGLLYYSPIEIRELAFLSEAYSNNPQMKLKALGVDLEKWSIEYAKSGWYPNINANMDYLYRSDNLRNMFNNRHMNFSVGATGTVSIFDGMSTLSKVKEAQARYAQAVLSQENVSEQIARDIKQGCLDLRESSAIILSQKDNLEEAKEALKISYISYDNGVGINLDVIDSQVALGQVEKNLASGMYDYIMAQAYLDRTMGREYFATIFGKNSKSEETDGKKK